MIGLVGGVFAVGTPYVAHWFDRSQQGMAMGVFGAGNVGAALNQLVAPVLLVGFGWVLVPQMYGALMLLTLLVFWCLSRPSPAAAAVQPAVEPVACVHGRTHERSHHG